LLRSQTHTANEKEHQQGVQRYSNGAWHDDYLRRRLDTSTTKSGRGSKRLTVVFPTPETQKNKSPSIATRVNNWQRRIGISWNEWAEAGISTLNSRATHQNTPRSLPIQAQISLSRNPSQAFQRFTATDFLPVDRHNNIG
jgi:hypothetical protein